MANVLLVDDDVASIALLKRNIEEFGHKVNAVFDAKSALENIRRFKYDVLVTDFNMPEMNGIELTEEVLKIEQDMVVILITAYGSVKLVVEAIRKGAFDYLSKPINKEELMLSIERGLERVSLLNENEFLKKSLQSGNEDIEYLTANPKVQDIVNEAKKVAKTDSTILITGANGTGKEVLAKYIHSNSNRKEKQFVVVNCAAIPSLLLESELFGHTKGAFTGAVKDHKGYFEISNNGTIFLDEIGELDTMLQVKLLRVIQEREFSRVGDTKIHTTDVRIIAATNKDLKKAITEGTFREDLYYRLNVFEFNLPELRERPEDINFYFEMFVKEIAEKNNKKDVIIDKEVKSILQKYSWPGNIRELKNIAERVTVLCENNIIKKDLLPSKIISLNQNKKTETNDYNKRKQEIIREFEVNFLTRYLKINKGNVAATAKAINFHPVSLRQKLSKLGINPNAFKI